MHSNDKCLSVVRDTVPQRLVNSLVSLEPSVTMLKHLLLLLSVTIPILCA